MYGKHGYGNYVTRVSLVTSYVVMVTNKLNIIVHVNKTDITYNCESFVYFSVMKPTKTVHVN